MTVGRPKVVSAKIRQKQAVLYCVENGDNSTTVLWLLGFGLSCALAQTARPNLSPVRPRAIDALLTISL